MVNVDYPFKPKEILAMQLRKKDIYTPSEEVTSTTTTKKEEPAMANQRKPLMVDVDYSFI